MNHISIAFYEEFYYLFPGFSLAFPMAAPRLAPHPLLAPPGRRVGLLALSFLVVFSVGRFNVLPRKLPQNYPAGLMNLIVACVCPLFTRPPPQPTPLVSFLPSSGWI